MKIRKDIITTSIADSTYFSRKYTGTVSHCFTPHIISKTQSDKLGTSNITSLNDESSTNSSIWASNSNTIMTCNYIPITGSNVNPPTSNDSEYCYPHSIIYKGVIYILEHAQIGKKDKHFLEASHNFRNGYKDTKIPHGAVYIPAETVSDKYPHTLYFYKAEAGFDSLKTTQKGFGKWFRHCFSSVKSSVSSFIPSATSALENALAEAARPVAKYGCDTLMGTGDVAEAIATDGAALVGPEEAEIAGELSGCNEFGNLVGNVASGWVMAANNNN